MNTWQSPSVQIELKDLFFADLETPEDLAPIVITDEERRSMNEYAEDQCSPSYWRGQDLAFAMMSEQLQKALDGHVSSGACQEPWNSLLKRVEALVGKCDTLESFYRVN